MSYCTLMPLGITEDMQAPMVNNKLCAIKLCDTINTHLFNILFL